MRKIAILLFPLLLNNITLLYGQAEDLTASGIRVGEKVPDIMIGGRQHFKDGPVRMNDFRSKLLIIDFWATWCSPCISMLPRLDSLQRIYKDEVTFLSVTYQHYSEVQDVIAGLSRKAGRSFEMLFLSEDSVLHTLFPHNVLPHYVWISPEGEVMAITGKDELNRENLEGAIQGTFGLRQKKDMERKYDPSIPLALQMTAGDFEKTVYYSVLTPYIEGIPAGITLANMKEDTGRRRITLRNTTLRKLFATAYGEQKVVYGNNRIRYLTKDKDRFSSALSGQAYIDWAKNNNYCYELMVPRRSADAVFGIMQKDLEMFFPDYRVQLKPEMRECLILTLDSAVDRLHSGNEPPRMWVDNERGLSVKNMKVENVVYNLNLFFMQQSPFPILEEIEDTHAIDARFGSDLSDIEKMNRHLARYGLKFIKAFRRIDVLTIEDRK